MAKSELLFLAVLASLPVQLGKFIFPDYAYVLGLPVDYRAITIYFSDIAISLYLIASLLRNTKNLKKIFLKDYAIALLAFNVYLLLSSLFFSVSKNASLFFNFKILIFSLFVIFATEALKNKNLIGKSKIVLAASNLWVCVLTIAQFINQGSLGIQIIGERVFDSSTVLIAHSELFGMQLLRPYATFPHPNVTAAYLAFSFILLAPFLTVKRNLAKIAIAVSTLVSIFLTYSKSALLVLLLAFFSISQSPKKLILFAIIFSLFSVIIFLQLSSYQVSSVAERLLLSQAGLDIALKNPIFGIGSNNFILELAKLNLFSLSETRLLQPVHNVFLLILAENGVAGLVFFTAFLMVVSRYLNSKTKLVIFIAILFYFSVDHFLWTLQQGQLIFWLLITFLLTQEKRSVK